MLSLPIISVNSLRRAASLGPPGRAGSGEVTFAVVQPHRLFDLRVRASAVARRGVYAAGLHQVNDVHAVDFRKTLGKVYICGIRTTLHV